VGGPSIHSPLLDRANFFPQPFLFVRLSLFVHVFYDLFSFFSNEPSDVIACALWSVFLITTLSSSFVSAAAALRFRHRELRGQPMCVAGSIAETCFSNREQNRQNESS
jgi:hypothetical protein